MRSFARVAFVVGVLVVTAAAQGDSFDYPALLNRLVDVNWLWQPPRVGERCVQFSSFDRRSLLGPKDHDAWYSNDDRGKYLRVEARDGKQEFVMVDAEGPGVVSRLWSANPSGMLHFDVDGARVWSVDFAQLCSGKLAPIGAPLAGMRSRGGNCHLPIPFQKHLKVSASAGDLYYQANVVTFAKGTTVPSFSPTLLEEHAVAIVAASERLQSGFPISDVGRVSADQVTLPDGPKRAMVAKGLVHELLLEVTKPGSPVDLGEVLRRVTLVVCCGSEETVRVPVADFFGSGADLVPWRSYLLEVRANGRASAWFPMPMPAGGSIELMLDGDLQGVRVRLAAFTRALPEKAGAPLLFRASYHQQKGLATRPFSEHLVLDAKGQGRFVGTSLLIKNPSRIWWGEGDEKFFVDGETFPSTFGTGTEDYFGYAWCCPEPFQSAFHAQVQCDGPGNYGFTALHRTHVLDSVPFQSAFRFDLEVWHWIETAKVDYATVAYWYGAPGATSGLPAVPPAAERTLDRLPPAPVFVAPDAIEGESLRVVSMSGGKNEVQDLSFLENTFSRDAQRWWRDGKVGDSLVLAVPVPAAGRYRIVGAFTTANDYGIVQVSLGKQRLRERLDGYTERVGTTGPLELGILTLPAGEAELRIELVGKHDKAKPSHMFGLDYLRLEKVE